jgi:hypothetical protein
MLIRSNQKSTDFNPACSFEAPRNKPLERVESLRLDSIKNISHPPENTQEICPNIVGCHRGVTKQGDKLVGIKSFIACKKWSCPVCSPKRAKLLRRRIFKGPLVAEAMMPGYRNSYGVKLLTLTCPGAEYRSRVKPGQADVEMKKHFANLEKSLKKTYGKHQYFWVEEPQKDGYPHLHIVFVGKNISGIEIKAYIERLWREEYGMGFVKMNVVNSIEHAIRYLTKYLTKGLEPIRPYSRVFSCSRGALLTVTKPYWMRSRFTLREKPNPGEDLVERREFDLRHGVPDHIWQAMTPDLKRNLIWVAGRDFVQDCLVL